MREKKVKRSRGAKGKRKKEGKECVKRSGTHLV
jgi:hypothetical protein